MSSQNTNEDKNNRCPFCNHTFSDLGDIELHFIYNHFLTMQSYYEMNDSLWNDERCFKCGNPRPPLTYIEPNEYSLPCWDCNYKKYERNQMVDTVLAAIKEYMQKVVKDRYLQMFLVSDLYFEWTLGHTYEDFRNVLKSLRKYGRDEIWFLDWVPGFPKTISKDNIDGIEVKNIGDWYKVVSNNDEIIINSWKVVLPEIIPFDKRHHSRYNIFNTASSPGTTKRLRLFKEDKDRCIKLYNKGEDSDNTKSIFSVTDLEGKSIQLSEQDLTVTKLVLMRNKTYIRLICSVVEELVRNAKIYSDAVFLRNTFIIDNERNDSLKINLSWSGDKTKEDFINISIL